MVLCGPPAEKFHLYETKSTSANWVACWNGAWLSKQKCLCSLGNYSLNHPPDLNPSSARSIPETTGNSQDPSTFDKNKNKNKNKNTTNNINGPTSVQTHVNKCQRAPLPCKSGSTAARDQICLIASAACFELVDICMWHKKALERIA